ncbi:GTP-binding protein [Flavobacteriaceae bacterium TP-CH-4]|uniref:GTP-binding protein n=1 Tax=Pelagihabitans pacificus TaxID=2696054 RepID=A0A967AP21_9FLAO|nr:GTP-binding protein [Pelagihabitans pacificus]NHF57749.1 GTP-binding protein [Pelagihabitans pacificus]
MKVLPNDIVLRPRFQMELSGQKETYLSAFEKSKKPPFLIKRIDDHVFIKFNKEMNHFWSPQLHLEIIEIDRKNCKLFGLFGPNPTLWTFFMFLHFGIATLFIILGIWAYSSASLDRSYGLQVGLMGFMVLLWIAFYIFGRLGKRQGKPQMRQLYQFMMEILL